MSKFAVILALTAAIAEAVSLHSRLQAIDFENNLAQVAQTAGDDVEINYDDMNMEILDETPGTDEYTQPLCAMGGQRGKQDLGSPSEFCCRIYELPKWHGRYFDLCAEDPNQQKPTTYDMDDINWRNEISSYKCGQKVGIRLCIEPQNGAALCNPNDSESGLPSSKNEEIEYNDLVEHVQIMPQSPYGATIFAKPGCKGKSAVIKADNSIAGSWTTYDDSSNTLLESGNVMSVIIHEEVEADFFSNGDFIGNSFAIRNQLGRSDECVELAFLSKYFGGKDHLTDSNRVEGDTNIHAAWAHIQWFPGYQSTPPVGFNDN